MSPITEPGWFWRMLFWRLISDILSTSWVLIFLLFGAVTTLGWAALKVAFADSVDVFAVVDDRTCVDFAYCKFLLAHPWILVIALPMAALLRWLLTKRNYSWPVQQAAMLPVYAALVMHILAMGYMGGKILSFGPPLH